jgi:hypothetical protein
LELLNFLRKKQWRGWHDILTLDESWLYLSTDYERIWMSLGEKVPDRERRTIHSPKFMATVVWNPSGFSVMKLLPNGSIFNNLYYITEILQDIVIW